MLLPACARGLLEARKTKAKFSFRTYMVDLVQLLKESMTGNGSTACLVCLSQALGNLLMQSKFALDFGEVFAKLSTEPRPVKAKPRTKEIKSSADLLRKAERVLSNPGGGGQFRLLLEAQKQDCKQQQLDILGHFSEQ